MSHKLGNCLHLGVPWNLSKTSREYWVRSARESKEADLVTLGVPPSIGKTESISEVSETWFSSFGVSGCFSRTGVEGLEVVQCV